MPIFENDITPSAAILSSIYSNDDAADAADAADAPPCASISATSNTIARTPSALIAATMVSWSCIRLSTRITLEIVVIIRYEQLQQYNSVYIVLRFF